MKRVDLRRSRYFLLALLLIVSNLTWASTQNASAATSGSAPCEQTFTVTGTGTGEVNVFEAAGYCYVAFKNTGAVNTQPIFTWSRPSAATSADVLVVGGGGGGGARHGGGGGSGGFVQTDSYVISAATTIAVAVGGGGAASTSYSGTSGTQSYFKPTAVSASGLIALGGGHGANGAAGDGGSGGGASSGQTAGLVTSQTQSTFAGVTLSGISFGNSGKAGASDTNDGGDPNDYWAGGGGGGAGGFGTNSLSNGIETTTFALNTSSTARGGSGGIGKTVTWLTPTIASGLSIGQTSSGLVYFAGGGGGGMGADGQSGGTGGLGGGATGTRIDLSGNPGTSFTGGGGGGSGFDDINKPGSTTTVTAAPAGAGGSGVVVVRYIWDVNAPTFTNSSTFSIAENASTLTNAATITVSESSTITITSGTDSALFTIVISDSVSAQIRFLAPPNFESPSDVGTNNVYNMSIRATDTFGNIANQSISITVTNVNEAPSITINGSAATHTITQAENISSIATYIGSDVDTGTTLSWSLSGTDAGDFSIGSASGVLSFVSNPDFEGPVDSDLNNIYIFIVNLSDGSLTDTQTVTLTITNTSESASIGSPSVSGAVNKGVNTTITVTSSVAGKVRFFVGGKRISKCLSRPTTGDYPNYSTTCLWKPAAQNRQLLTAVLTPSDNTFTPATSLATTVTVGRRTTLR